MRSINNYKNVFNKRKKQPLEKFIIEVVYNLPGNKNAYYININGKFVGAYHEEVPGSARELAKHKLRGYANLFDMPAIKDSQILYVNTDYQK